MEGRPHGSLTSSDGYGRANSASYPAYTDSGHGRQGQQRLEHSKHGQLRWRGGLMGLSYLATATAGPTAPHTQHTRTAETTAGLIGPCTQHIRTGTTTTRASRATQERQDQQGYTGASTVELAGATYGRATRGYVRQGHTGDAVGLTGLPYSFLFLLTTA